MHVVSGYTIECLVCCLSISQNAETESTGDLSPHLLPKLRGSTLYTSVSTQPPITAAAPLGVQNSRRK